MVSSSHVGQRVDHRHADAVQAARNLVGILVELPAGVELGHDHLGGGDAFFGVDVGRDAAAVVFDRDRAIGVQLHGTRSHSRPSASSMALSTTS